MEPYIACGIFVIVSLLFSLLGYLIKYRGRVNLIAGYEEEKVKDKAGLGKWVGDWFFILSSGWLVFSLSFLPLRDFIPYTTLFLTFFTVFSVIRLCKGAATFYS